MLASLIPTSSNDEYSPPNIWGEFPALGGLHFHDELQLGTQTCDRPPSVTLDSARIGPDLGTVLDLDSRKVRLSLGLDTISILVPVYNEEESLRGFVKEMTESAFFRSAKVGEIILCLNGCTDRSLPIAMELSAQFDKLKVILIPEKNKNLAWQHLVSASSDSSSVLFFVDADVRLGSDTLERLDSALESNSHLAIAGSFALPMLPLDQKASWFQQARVREATDPRCTNRRLEFEPGLTGACYAIRREVAASVQMPVNPSCADDNFLHRTFLGRVTILREANVHYGVPNFRDQVRQDARAFVGGRSMNLCATELPNFDPYAERASPFSKINMNYLWQAPLQAKLFYLARGLAMGLGTLLGHYYVMSGKDPWTKIPSTKTCFPSESVSFNSSELG